MKVRMRTSLKALMLNNYIKNYMTPTTFGLTLIVFLKESWTWA
jgi:hypothetical protein